MDTSFFSLTYPALKKGNLVSSARTLSCWITRWTDRYGILSAGYFVADVCAVLGGSPASRFDWRFFAPSSLQYFSPPFGIVKERCCHRFKPEARFENESLRCSCKDRDIHISEQQHFLFPSLFFSIISVKSVDTTYLDLARSTRVSMGDLATSTKHFNLCRELGTPYSQHSLQDCKVDQNRDWIGLSYKNAPNTVVWHTVWNLPCPQLYFYQFFFCFL